MWLLEKKAEAERLDRDRFQTIRWWTIIAAFASVIAAITGTIALFR
jgi:hypothetical protein